MNVLVVGCGKVGSRLANTLCDEGIDVSVIARTAAEADKMLEPDFKGSLLCGVPIDQDNLKKAGIESCDVVCAVTDDDNTNIMVSQLAKRLYQVKKTIAKVNNPKNVEALKKLGVDIVVSSTDNITGQLEREIDSGKIKELLPLGAGNAGVFEIVLDNSFTLQNVPLMEMEIPLTLNIISIIRNETELIIPRGHTTLEIGDKLMILSKIKDKNDIFKAFKIKA